MVWFYLFIAGLFEISWAIGLKYTDGLTRLWPTIATAVAMIISFFFLSLAVKELPVGTAYAIWTGIGAAGTAVLGMILFNEPRTFIRLMCILLILLGVIGLRLFSGHD